jgi:predicted ArsR family transcriptional regulator
MMNRTQIPYADLKQVFHEPSRMAIITALCAREDGVSFADLKAQCRLTDGNLNRHLKALADAGAARVEKVRDGARGRTVVHATSTGREHFFEYLGSLETVLRHTADALGYREQAAYAPLLWPAVAVSR